MAQEILTAKNLEVELDGETILKDISFSVSAGEALAIIGPNGSGKTTLFRVLLGLLPYQGQFIWRPGVKVGYVPQKMSLERNLPISVKEFFLLKSNNFWFEKKSFSSHLKHELDLVGLNENILNKRLGELSGGQWQRLLISWAMLQHPDVLLFDEPTSNIDAGFEETMYNVIRRMQKERGTTVILISHDISIVYRHADRVVCLNNSIICIGPPQKVLTEEVLRNTYGEGAFYHSHK